MSFLKKYKKYKRGDGKTSILNHNLKPKIKFTNTNKENILAIMGNGPSLAKVDFNLFRKYNTFGLNAAYKKYDELKFNPTYFGSFDPKLVETHYNNYKNLLFNSDIKKFYFWNLNTKFKKQFSPKDENQVKYQKIDFNNSMLNSNYNFLDNPISFNNFPQLYNSGACATLIGILLGYKKIYLYGCEENYIEYIPESKLIDNRMRTLKITKTPDKNPNYWFKNYQEKGELYSIPDSGNKSNRMMGWKFISLVAKYYDIEIINCCTESKIPFFKNNK